MALNLEELRAAARGEKLPELEGKALELSNERSHLRKESISLKTDSGGRDEIPGTPEFNRIQEIGKRLREIEQELQQFGAK